MGEPSIFKIKCKAETLAKILSVFGLKLSVETPYDGSGSGHGRFVQAGLLKV